MTSFVHACHLSDLPGEDEAISVEVNGEPVAIVSAAGDYYAIRDVCSHAEVPLSEGEVDGTTIQCWLHGSRFDLRTGEPTGMPATEPVPVYPIKFEGDDVLIAISQES